MLNPISRAIDAFITKQGEVTSLLILPLLVVVIYEVFMRYILNAPTIWGFETTTFLYGMHFMFGLSFTDVAGGHVKVDIFTSRAAPKIQALLRVLTNLVFFLPVVSGLTIWSFLFFLTSLQGREVNSTSWAPPVYPFKFIMALALLFLLLQGISNLLRDFQVLVEKTDATGR